MIEGRNIRVAYSRGELGFPVYFNIGASERDDPILNDKFVVVHYGLDNENLTGMTDTFDTMSVERFKRLYTPNRPK